MTTLLPVMATGPKQMQPLDASRPSLARLGHDILLLVLEALQSSHPLSLKNTRLVCSNLSYLSEYVGMRDVKLDLSQIESPEATKHLARITNRGLFPAIRTIEAIGPGAVHAYAENDTHPNRERGLQCLPLMTGLRDVKLVNGTLSPKLCELLAGSPRIRLHIKLQCYVKASDAKKLLQLLYNNINLYSLDIEFTYTHAGECSDLTQPLKQVLRTSPNIREVTLDIDMPGSGCVVYCEPWDYCGFGFVNGERPPPLRKMHVKSYPFGEKQKPGPKGPHSSPYADGYPSEVNEVDYWASEFDWSQLKSLAAPDADLALRLMPNLTALEEVSIHRSISVKQEANFYLNVPTTLHTISVKSLSHITLPGILRHGQTLRSLSLHQLETYDTNKSWAAEAIDNASLLSILASCPHLTTLSLDLARNETFPYPVLDTIARFPRLHTLTIYFELGVTGDVVLPKVTFSVVESLFEYIWHRCPALSQLDIYSGSPPRIGWGYPSRSTFWPMRNSCHFRCTPAVRDDERAKGKFWCECPELSRGANRNLRGEAEVGVEPGVALGDDAEMVAVARHGPRSREPHDFF